MLYILIACLLFIIGAYLATELAGERFLSCVDSFMVNTSSKIPEYLKSKNIYFFSPYSFVLITYLATELAFKRFFASVFPFMPLQFRIQSKALFERNNYLNNKL